jgi:hypothetical protein
MTIQLDPANIRTSRSWVLGVSSGVFEKGEAIVSGDGQSLHDAVQAPRHQAGTIELARHLIEGNAEEAKNSAR